MCELERTNVATPAAGIDRYSQYEPVDLPDRQWPTRTMTAPPRWCSVDLRDGNQALVNPMDLDRKHALFQLLVDMGYREIEVAFPAASQTEFDFVRQLVERDLIPDDVTIQVITPARPELIARTFESIRGADRAIVHLYNSTSTLQRDVVFRKNRAEITALAADGTRLCRKHAEENPATEVQFEYTPESFTGTELDFALEICDEVSEVWEPTSELPIIVNLPATVEMSTPNVYADRIEWMGRSLRHRANTVISVHPHNDRGTGVAAAELAVLAGAQRVEGCLFGNGERTGNVCLVTLGLNLYTQGIDPGIDFSDIDAIRRTVERCNQLPVHPRHPYGGELVYTSFSGSHQDAIKKGLDEMRATAGPRPWAVPYLPIDPKDVGRTYQAVIRVNSQSGKGGVAYLLEAEHELDLPRELQVDFSHLVQKHTDQRRTEVAADEIWAMFESEYVRSTGPLVSCSASAGSVCADHGEHCVVLEADGRRTCMEAGDQALPAGLVSALKRLGLGEVDLRRCVDHPIGPDGERRVAAYCEIGLGEHTTWGVGIDGSRAVALLDAATSAVNRALSAAVPIG